jgi:hypothetical protein
MADRLYTSSEADEVLSALRFETKLEKATLAARGSKSLPSKRPVATERAARTETLQRNAGA